MTTGHARSRLAKSTMFALLATATTGCGWFFTHGPPAGYQQMSSFSCTQSIAAPVLDLVGFAWFTINAQVNAKNGNVAATAGDGVLTVALILSGLSGSTKIRKCRAAQAELLSRRAPGAPVAAQPPPPPAAQAPPAATQPGPVPAAIGMVTVNAATDTLSVGQTLQLAATAWSVDAVAIGGAAFTWSSSDTTVAVVSGTGLVRARRPGGAWVRAEAGSVVGGAWIVVRRR